MQLSNLVSLGFNSVEKRYGNVGLFQMEDDNKQLVLLGGMCRAQLASLATKGLNTFW